VVHQSLRLSRDTRAGTLHVLRHVNRSLTEDTAAACQ
jgi:hypothetical protein